MAERKNQCVYEGFVQTTPDKIWSALTTPDVTKEYWFGYQLEAVWTVGSAWRLTAPDGKVHAAGQIVEIDRPRRIVISWRDEIRPEVTAEGYSKCTIDLEPHDDSIHVTVTHAMDRNDIESKLIALVATSWPKVVSSLKSFLETGGAKPRP